jgi:hypothetical protein
MKCNAEPGGGGGCSNDINLFVAQSAARTGFIRSFRVSSVSTRRNVGLCSPSVVDLTACNDVLVN